MRNDGGNKSNWRKIPLGTEDTRDGVGALIEIDSGPNKQWRRVHGSGSYLSHSDLPFRSWSGTARRLREDHLAHWVRVECETSQQIIYSWSTKTAPIGSFLMKPLL